MSNPLQDKVDQFIADEGLNHQYVNGDQNTVVQTIGGPVPSLAKQVKDNDALILASGLLGQVGASKDAAVLAKAAAEAARDAALIQAGLFVDEPTGRGAVADGVAFKVQGSGNIAAYEYRRVNAATVSPLIAVYPSYAYIDSLKRVGKNVFDNTQPVIVNAQIGATGGVTTNAGWSTSVTGFIPVSPSTQYSYNSPSGAPIAQYTASMAFISKATATNAAPFTTDPSCAYIRVQFDPAILNTMQIEAGPTPSTYEAFQKLIDSSLLNLPTFLARTEVQLALAQLSPGKNLFDANQALTATAQIHATSGNVITNAAWSTSVTGFIPASASSAYVVNTTGAVFVGEYGSRKEFLGLRTQCTSAAPLTLSANTKYVRLEFQTAIIATLQFEKGSATTGYEAYALGYRGQLSAANVMAAVKAGQSDPSNDLATLLNLTTLLARADVKASLAQLGPGKNLFDASQPLTATAQINAITGVINTNAGWSTTVTNGLIPVVASTTYVVNTTGAVFVGEYNASGAYLGLLTQTSSSTPLTLSANTRYVRLQYQPAITATLQLEKGTVPTTYEAYSLGFRGVLDATNVMAAVKLAQSDPANDIASLLSLVTLLARADVKAAIALLGPGKNIFDANQSLTANAQINSSGVVGVNAGWSSSVTGLIPVDPSTTYAFNTAGANTRWRNMTPPAPMSAPIRSTTPAFPSRQRPTRASSGSS